MAAMTNTYESLSWEEHNFVEIEGGVKIAHATVTYRYTGQLEGESRAQGLLTYRPDGTGTFVSTEYFTGAVDGRKGTVVLQHAGDFDAEHITSRFHVEPGTGGGDLVGLTGSGEFDMKMGTPSVEYTFTP
ncbi:hypothetical protein GCM10029964_117330 [Kibdelosporangium lantanae]